METWQEATDYYKKASQGEQYTGNKRRRQLKRSLPALTSFVDQSTIVSTVELGEREIQLDRVIGTYYNTRGNMFAGDFIPLADDRTEFAAKWISLCQAQLNEGIRDPILVYEYLNYYYVQEGNKRVSVLKYFDAAVIRANVIRLVPAYDEQSLDIRMYYAFLNFYEQTDYEDIWFRKTGCFDSMIAYMDAHKGPDSYKEFLSAYYIRFRRNYKKVQNQLTEASGFTTGDIFLRYCQMFGVEDLSEEALKRRLQDVVNNIDADQLMVVDEAETANLTSALMPSFRKLRVAFAFPAQSDTNGWSRDHYRGLVRMREIYGGQVTIDVIEDVMDRNTPFMSLERAVKGKYDFIFLVDDSMLAISERLAVDYPKTTFMICSGGRSSYLVPNYFGKIHQTNFLLGMYAALACEFNRVGYVSCDMSETIFKAMRAFEAGFKSVRPRGLVIYASSEEALPENIKVSAYYRSVEKSHLTEGTVNTYLKKKGNKVYMAYTYWQWEKFYGMVFAHLVNGSLKKLRSNQKEAKNLLFFHWGLGTEVIGVHLNKEMPSAPSEMMYKHITADIAEGRMNIDGFCETRDYDSWYRIHRSRP